MSDRYHEPTMEEVEATVAEQMQNLPPWWDGSRDVEEHTGRCRECGRAMPIAAKGRCHRCYRANRRRGGGS